MLIALSFLPFIAFIGGTLVWLERIDHKPWYLK